MNPDWKAIEAEEPGLKVKSIDFLGEGWCSRVYLVNRELVFRFPKRAEQWEELHREIRLLDFAADRLPLAVPRYCRVARDHAVYRYLSGDLLNPATAPGAAETLAGFLQAMHSLDPPPPLRDLLPREDQRANAKEDLARAESVIIPNLSPNEAETLRRRFEEYLSTPANFSFRPVVLHADLANDHILAQKGMVTGILDFGDACWGDADYDFMYLYVDFGRELALDVALRYGRRDLESLERKLLYFAITDQIGTILDGAGRAPAGSDARAWKHLHALLSDRR